jgi:hypothetical protein
MVLFLYSNNVVEHQAISCLKSLEHKITDDVQIVYYTIGFMSSFTCKNLHKVRIEPKDYPNFCFYKPELSLRTIEMFPDEQYFVFTDTDVLFSHRLNFQTLKSYDEYPNASYGPHEYPFIFNIHPNGTQITYNEVPLMEYYGVLNRSCRYVWSCFYLFNRNCIDFLEEWASILYNKYLIKNREIYFPFSDETSFNVCLWKRNATNMLGFNYLNTHNADLIQRAEAEHLVDFYGDNYDQTGALWEYINDSNDIIFYHGMKEISDIKKCMSVLGIK